MKRQTFKASIFATMLAALAPMLGCNSQKADDKGSKAGQKDVSSSGVQEVVDVVPGKAITPKDQARVAGLALKVLGHVSRAGQDIQAKNVDAAKKELTQAGTLLDILKEVLPSVKLVDHIWVANTDLSYIETTEVQQDLVPIMASLDQLYDLLPAGNAKDHAKQAKAALTKEKQKGATKAKAELGAVEEALDFRETDLSVAYTSRFVKEAQADLEKGKTKEASDALKAVAEGVLFVDASVVNPVDVAVRRIWLVTQDYARKDYPAAKARLGKAKQALQEVAQDGDKTLQEAAKQLLTQADTIDVTKAGDKTGAALEALWQNARKLVDPPQVKDKK